MADFSSKTEPSFATSVAATKKKPGPSVNSSWLVMILSGVIAAVIFLVVTASPEKKVEVLVAANDIQTGQQVDDSDFKAVAVNLDAPQLNRLIKFTDRSAFIGFTASGPITNGDFISKSQLRQQAAFDGLQAMSIPVDPSHANGGNLARGDIVNILDETTGQFVANRVQVIDVKAGSQGGALASASSFSVTVAVTTDQALAIGGALKNNKFDIIRATGATK